MKKQKFLKSLLSSLMAISTISATVVPVIAEDAETEPEISETEEALPETEEEVLAEEEVAEEADDELGEEIAIIEEETAVSEALTFEEALDDVTISVEAPEGAFPAGTEMVIENVEDEDVLKAIQEQVGPDAKVIAAVDITFKNADEEIQPEEAVQVSIKADDITDKGNLSIVHVDNKSDELKTELIDQKEVEEALTDGVVFDAEHFSIYAIVAPGDEQSDPETYSTKYEFWYNNQPYVYTNTDGEETSYQYVGNGETLYYPGTPVCNEDLVNPQFKGWFDEADNLVLDPNKDTENGIVISGITENQTIKLNAKFEATYYIVYHDNSEANVLATESFTSGQNISLKEGDDWRVIYQLDAHEASNKAFIGWATEFGKTGSSSVVESVNITNGTIELWPVIAPVYWYNFDKNDWEYTEADPKDANYKNVDGKWVKVEPGTDGTHVRSGTGAAYVAPRFVLQGESYTTRYGSDIPELERRGYRFDGWFYDEELTNAFNPNTAPTENVDLYAKWTPDTQNYSVIVWKQKLADNKDATDAKKTYDYESSASITSTTGATATVAQQYKNYTFKGFHYSRCDADTEVAADGSTVLNVYYDRNQVTINFYYGPNAQQIHWQEGWNTYYAFGTNTASSNWQKLYEFTGLYGQLFSKYNYTWPADYAWHERVDSVNRPYNSNNQRLSGNWYYPAGTNQTYLSQFSDVTVESADNVYNLYATTSPGDTKIYHYIENVNSTNSDNQSNYSLGGSTNSGTGTFYFSNKFDGFTVYAYKIGDRGTFTKVPSSGQVDYNNTLYVYHKRNSYTVDFYDTFGGGKEPLEDLSKSVKFEASLKDSKPADLTDSHEGYYFSGWYQDPECTKPFDFDNEIMPANNIAIYGGWSKYRFRVWIQPNGGVLSGTESTWFNVDYGELIENYSDIAETRDYIESDTGEYIYVIYDHSDTQRTANYVKLSEATDDEKSHALLKDDGVTFVTYEFMNNAYSFYGWFKVTGKEMGTYDDYVANGRQNGDEVLPPEIKPNDEVESYTFGTPTKEDTALRAIWRRSGTIEIFYDPNGGTVPEELVDQYVDDEGNPITIRGLSEGFPLTENIFSDLSQNQAEYTPIAPEGKYFVGWRTPYDELIQPNDMFTVYASLSENLGTRPDNTPWYRYFLTAEYAEVDAVTSIEYNINAPTGATPSSSELTDLGTPVDQSGNEYTGYSAGTNKIEKLILNSAIKLSDGTGFTVPGYKFLGWNDDEAEADNGNVKFEAGKTYGIGAADVTKGNVLYAVWGAPNFAVVHSSDGTIEYPNDLNYVKGSTLNIYARTKAKHIYGGYYKAYAGVDEAKWNTAGTQVELTGWKNYTGEAGQQTYWSYKDGCKENGAAMYPEDGAIYFLKEVPSYFMKPYTQYVYNVYYGNEVTNLIALGALDDNNYKEIGFATINSTDAADLVPAQMKSLYGALKLKKNGNIIEVTSDTAVKLAKDPDTGALLADSDKSYGGYVMYIKNIFDYKTKGKAQFDYVPYFITKDGINVVNNTDRTLIFDDWIYYTGEDHKTKGVRPVDTKITDFSTVKYTK